MRISTLVFAASMLGVCAIPARADYVFDFQFGGNEGYYNHTFGPSEIVYQGTTVSGPTTLRYVSGSMNGGYAPPTAQLGTYLLKGQFPTPEFTAQAPGSVGDFAIVGFDVVEFANNFGDVGSISLDPSQLLVQVPNSFFTPGATGYFVDDINTEATLTITQTPEPSSLLLLGTGVVGAAGVVRRRLGV